MRVRRTSARRAMAEALRLRQRTELGLADPICVYELAAGQGIEVRFVEISTMEGSYIDATQPHILISSLRPSGRRSFTCAHELGHHMLGHGSTLDEFVSGRNEPQSPIEEFEADCFAGILLMPKVAIDRAFMLRGWKAEHCTPAQAYVLSNLFGVGYSTFIHHLESALRILSRDQANKLLKVSPRKAQALATGWESTSKAWVVDEYWTGRPIDVEVGDLIKLEGATNFDGRCVENVDELSSNQVLIARQPGIARLESHSGWCSFVRVSRANYAGRLVFRHEEEAAD